MRRASVMFASALVCVSACGFVTGLDGYSIDDSKNSGDVDAGFFDGAVVDGFTVADGSGVDVESTKNDANTGDAAFDQDAAPLEPSFEVDCNGSKLAIHSCPNKRWEHNLCNLPDAGSVVILRNTGGYPLAFIARSLWNPANRPYTPGEKKDGTDNEIHGVLEPGAIADLTASYAGGIFAILGSPKPFPPAPIPDAGFKEDESMISWEAGALDGVPTSFLWIAELTEPVQTVCYSAPPMW